MAVSRDFVLAGNATFTIEVPEEAAKKHASHYTYRVEHVPASEVYPRDTYFVQVLRGPNNTSDFVYLGVLDPFLGQVKRTKASKFPEHSFRYRLLNRILVRIWGGDHKAYEQFGYRTHHEGKCGRCGRKLTVPHSIESGIGPECARIMAGGAA